MRTYMQAPNGEVFETSNPEWHKDCTDLGSGKAGKQARQEYTRKQLRGILPPGSTVYGNVLHVSSSGMTRAISFHAALLDENGRPYIRSLDHLMQDATGRKESKHGGLIVQGCDMNMIFSSVYYLSSSLYPEGFGISGKTPAGKAYRPKTKKQAQQAVKRGVVFRGRNGDTSGWDADGGYALGYASL